jgi:hypothetical protein
MHVGEKYVENISRRALIDTGTGCRRQDDIQIALRDSSNLRQGPMMSHCGHSNESLDSIKSGQYRPPAK